MVRNTYEVQNIGDLLREKRKQLGKDIKQVSEHTKIRAEYLLALETGNYDKFASDVYAKGFMKKYAKYLGISPERASAMYRREKNPEAKTVVHSTDYLQKRFSKPLLELTPGRLASFAIIVALMLFVGYLISQVSVVLRNPELSISVPVIVKAGEQASYTTTLEKLTLRGDAELGSQLTLNGKELNVNSFELFEQEVTLAAGENKYLFIARNQFGQESKLTLIIIRNVGAQGNVAGQNNTGNNTGNNTNGGTTNNGSTNGAGTGTNPPVQSIAQKVKVRIEVQDRDAYIQVKTDGQPSFADVLTVGSIKEFQANTSFAISSPRPDTILLTVNGKDYVLANAREYLFELKSTGEITVTNAGS